MGKIGFPFGGLDVPLFSGVSPGAGGLYVVADSTSAAIFADASKRFGNLRNGDGSPVFWPHSSTSSVVTTNGLVNALACCVAGRGDYVVVLPSPNYYYTDATLALAVKNVHFVAPFNFAEPYGAMRQVVIQQIGAYAAFTVSAQSCEIAGIFLKCKPDYTGISISASSHGCYIHHNFIGMGTTSGGTFYGIYGAGESTNVHVSKNWVGNFLPTAGQTIAGGIYAVNGTRWFVSGNFVTTGGFTTTLSSGINTGSGAQSVISDNIVVEDKTVGGSTLSLGIVCPSTGMAYRNLILMTTANKANALSGAHADMVCLNYVVNSTGGELTV